MLTLGLGYNGQQLKNSDNFNCNVTELWSNHTLAGGGVVTNNYCEWTNAWMSKIHIKGQMWNLHLYSIALDKLYNAWFSKKGEKNGNFFFGVANNWWITLVYYSGILRSFAISRIVMVKIHVGLEPGRRSRRSAPTRKSNIRL